ncbi:MAG: bifunctional UDP-N-acetylglucosamine diphosphorylase/glucosamine-1-phosphate N-acetyltransferase GlmU [Clostridiales bacterium]|nr:bifunctional UDP-N-acetylglucosamine diphosphorylase/glucosamine-1-phosphate N-acetyltransferase GlmU [Clostridiales bacterium]
MSKNCAIILAGGEGKRMKSTKPKAMCEVLFKPMIDWVIDAVKDADIDDICVVTGHKAEILKEHVQDRCEVAFQAERLGTGHAVMQCKDFLKNHLDTNVLVLNGDAPLMDSETISNSLKAHSQADNSLTVITAELDNPFGYGRIVRDSNNQLEAIVEQKDANEEQKAIKEVNSGAFWFKADKLLNALDKLTNNNSQGEYYLTDTVTVLKNENNNMGAFIADSSDVILGANDRVQLLELNEKARKEEITKHLINGVDIACTDGVVIGKGVEIGADTKILPNTILLGKTKIGENCIIGPNSRFIDTTVGNFSKLDNVLSENAKVGDNADIGPFVHLRPNTSINNSVHLGNFVEVKNSNIDDGTKVSHLTYVGDSDVGKECNFGCGCVTVNYTGKHKFRTTIGNHAFIGCNTNLIAPVTVGDYAYTAAGSTITEDVPADALGIARARQVNKIDYVKIKKPYKGMD